MSSFDFEGLKSMQLNLAGYKNRHTIKSRVARAIWNIVWLFLFRPTPERVRIFSVWRIFLLRLFGAKIGRPCAVMASVKIWQPWNLELGNWVVLSEEVNCYTVNRITIGNQTTISREVFLCCATHDTRSPIMELIDKPIHIGGQVWIGARTFVVPGVTVGEGAVVGACSVVTHDVKPWCIVAGNPAKFIRNRILADS